MFDLDKRNCPICNKNPDQNRLLGILESSTSPFKNIGTRFPLTECTDCGIIHLGALPKKEDLYKMYTEQMQFNSEAYTGEKVKDIMAFYKNRMNKLINKTGLDRNNLKTLEIGGGLSWVSRAIKSFNEKNFTIVQDLTTECIDQCIWVDNYFIGEIEELESKLKKNGPYHIISMTHVFEHVINPLETLKLCKRLLDKNGTIFITAPYRPKNWNEGSNFSDWIDWSYNHVPAHLNYYNENALRILAQKTGLCMEYFSASDEEEQAFEAWFKRLPIRNNSNFLKKFFRK